jgi:hypothetical protein
MDGDKEPFGVEAMHLDESVVVWCGAVDDDKDDQCHLDFNSESAPSNTPRPSHKPSGAPRC